MPEDQNYNGDQWNIAVNTFLIKVLGWKQLGTSNVDVKWGPNPTDVIGLDSVFAYRTHERSHQQVVLVEAKNRKAFKDLGQAKMQEWVNVLLKKLELGPPSADFLKKFPVDEDAQFSVGLIAAWVRETAGFDADVLAERLKQLEVVEKKTPLFLYFLDNLRLTRMLSVHEEVNRLTRTEEYKDPLFVYPPNGSDLLCDGTVMPLEALFSDVLFYRITKREFIKGAGKHVEYPIVLCFYFGRIETIDDLRFIDLAIRDLGFHDSREVQVYITPSVGDIRSELAMHTKESDFNLVFKRLSIRTDLPDWLGEE